MRVAGFDYRAGQPLSLTRSEWRERVRATEAAGGVVERPERGGDLLLKEWLGVGAERRLTIVAELHDAGRNFYVR